MTDKRDTPGLMQSYRTLSYRRVAHGERGEKTMAKRRGFGYIRKTSAGRFQASYIVNGVRYNAPHTFGTRYDAETYLAETQTAISKGEWLAPSLTVQTFRDYALSWFANRKDDLAPKTARLYADTLDRLLLPYLGVFSMKDITPLAVKQWRGQVKGYYSGKAGAGNMPQRGSTGQTRMEQAYRLLHTIMAEAVRDGVIGRNPCNIKNAGGSRTAERKPATMEELDMIAANMPERYRAFVYVAAWSGLRFSELAGLRRRDVVLVAERGTGELVYRLNVDKQTYSVGGVLYEDAKPKTDAGRRVVYLPPHVTDVLAEHMSRFVNEPPESYVFGSRNGTPMRNNVVGKAFRRARHEAGRDDLRIHDLRHTGATLAARAGATTKDLMQRLGHSSMRAALIYQHSSEDADMQLAARMSDMVTAGRERTGATA